MAKTKDTSSTEKLLQLIRGNPETAQSQEKQSKNAAIKKPSSSTMASLFGTGRKYTVGVDVGQDFLYLVKMTGSAEGKPVWIDSRIIPCSQFSTRDSDEFKSFLKESITNFSGQISSCSFWAMIPSADVNIVHIKIPRVARKQMNNVIYWTAKKENPIDEKESVFDYEIQAEITDQGMPKYAVMVYTAPRDEVEKLKAFFASAGIALEGITIAPYAVQNIFRTKWLNVSQACFATLFIGTDFSRIDIYKDGHLAMTRGVKTGITSMVEAIEEAQGEAPHGKPMTREESKQAFRSYFASDASNRKVADNLGLTRDQIMDMVEPAMDRLTRQIERTLEYYTTSVGYERVEKLYVSSTADIYLPILERLQDQLGLEAELFDPFAGRAIPGISMLPAESRIAMTPALGLALSDRLRTPNLIFTYREKKREENERMINRVIVSAFAMILLICAGILVHQAIQIQQNRSLKTQLEKELALYDPVLSTEKVAKVKEDLKGRLLQRKHYARKYVGMAVIGELSAQTPNHVRLLALRIAQESAVAKGKDQKPSGESDDITIEGIVRADREQLDAMLANYVMKLENSPMFRQVVLQKSAVVPFRKEEVLHFTLKAKTG